MEEELLSTIMTIIMKSGQAKDACYRALQAAKKGEETETLLQEATDFMNEAHQAQTTLMSQEASGVEFKLSLLVVHAQDHLMTTLTYMDLVKELIALYEQGQMKRD